MGQGLGGMVYRVCWCGVVFGGCVYCGVWVIGVCDMEVFWFKFKYFLILIGYFLETL